MCLGLYVEVKEQFVGPETELKCSRLAAGALVL